MKLPNHVIHIIKNIVYCYAFCYIYGDLVMHVIINRNKVMLNCTHEKGKLVEKSGRKTTYLRSLYNREYGRRVTMEKSVPTHANLPGQNYSVGRLL